MSSIKLCPFALVLGTAVFGSRLAGQEPGPEVRSLPESVDLRPEFARLGLTPRSQGRRPTCSVFTVVTTLEFALAKATGEPLRLSPEFANRAKNIVTKRPHDGGFFHDILSGLAAEGIARESSFPYADRFDPAATAAIAEDELGKEAVALKDTITRRLAVTWIKPWSNSQKGLDEQQFAKVRDTLARGLPVATGMAHSRTLVGYRDDPQAPGGGVFLTLDSGVGRFAEVSYEFVRSELFDVFVFDILPEPPKTDRGTTEKPAKKVDQPPPASEVNRELRSPQRPTSWSRLKPCTGGSMSDLGIAAQGTESPRTDLEALARTPYGGALTCGDLKLKIGRPTAIRAVARANATRPTALVVPCQREIGSDGKANGYCCVVAVKEALLVLDTRLSGSDTMAEPGSRGRHLS